jgi:hypothetical protein
VTQKDEGDEHEQRKESCRQHRRIAYAGKFSAKYAHRLITGGSGHNLPQEAPEAFARAVIDADGFRSQPLFT